jgi:tryptophanyl-tRNA synthetase
MMPCRKIGGASLFCYYRAMQRLFTGLQPSGTLHMGNYFAALRPAVELSKEYDSMVMLADYHALTTLKDGAELRANTLELARDYLAAGIDPMKTIIFKQSDVLQHTELGWIFQCLVTVSFLELAHAYKDKVAKGLEANAGLFAYPMLMAADILLYDADVVPVGLDQRQHVEYAREAAAKFNNAFGVTFKEPKEMILSQVATVPGTDGQKMSKSYKNTIPLFGTKDEIAKAVMGIVTDSKGDRPEHVYAIHKLFRQGESLEAIYTQNAGKYKALKEALVADIESTISPMRERRDAITDEEVKSTLIDGARRAGERAQAKMAEVREKIGIAL